MLCYEKVVGYIGCDYEGNRKYRNINKKYVHTNTHINTNTHTLTETHRHTKRTLRQNTHTHIHTNQTPPKNTCISTHTLTNLKKKNLP